MKKSESPFLRHHGILGMRWGRRTIRGVNVSGTTSVRGKLTSRLKRGKPIHSSEAIKKMVEDVKSKTLSQRFKDMNPEKLAKGERIATNIMKAGLGTLLLLNLPRIMRITNKVLVKLTPPEL